MKRLYSILTVIVALFVFASLAVAKPPFWNDQVNKPRAGELSGPHNPGGNPDLPPGHPFDNVQSNDYWSATTSASDTGRRWGVSFSVGGAGTNDKSDGDFVWCVRGGMNADAY